jgi:cytochrome c556
MRASIILPGVAVVALLFAGCEAAANPAPELAQKVLEVRQRMHVRFAATAGIQAAITYGDLERAQAEAKLVAELDEPDILPEWRPYLDNVRAVAKQLTTSKDAVAAAKQLATLGWRCAQCHEAVPGSKPVFPKLPEPPADPKLAATMASHQWATARMWEGLIGPSAERWNKGAAVLAKAPLTITAEGEVPGHELGIADDVARLRVIATGAPKAKVAFDRAEVYGRLLATCAHCHHTIRDR